MHTGIRFFSSHLFIALALCSGAAIQHFWLAPRLERLPADYASETSYAARCRFHLTPAAPEEEYDLVTRRRDVVLSSLGGHSIIQGDAHWITSAGVVMFEVQNLYRVDRATRANAAGLGNADRNGQYFFPPHTERKTYGLWDPFYAGPRVATYHHTEQLDGLTVYVFNFVAEDLDETAGYVSLPDVPEKYRASTDGRGKIWVEPLTGIAVASGIDGYLFKPLEKAALIAILDGVSQSGVFTVSTTKSPRLLNEATQIRTALDEFDLALSET
ncbi:MAG: DUF3068 domain-containing protein [Verrucomicrobiota bacterium]|nr:DUF3068 domain-containing protein [Verrucomicrobiota bacterium]